MSPKDHSPLLSVFTFLKGQIIGSRAAFVDEFFHKYSQHKWIFIGLAVGNSISGEAHLLERVSHFLNTDDMANFPALKENTTACQAGWFTYHEGDACFSYHEGSSCEFGFGFL